jgi:ABC-2 type transport system ATP-binding protein
MLHVRLTDPATREQAARLLTAALDESVQFDSVPESLSVRSNDPERVAMALAELARAGIGVAEFALGQPSLDEVFLDLTGHPADEQTDEEDAA